MPALQIQSFGSVAVGVMTAVDVKFQKSVCIVVSKDEVDLQSNDWNKGAKVQAQTNPNNNLRAPNTTGVIKARIGSTITVLAL